MNSIVRAALRINGFRPLLSCTKTSVYAKNAVQQRQLARNFWYMCNVRNDHSTVSSTVLKSPSEICSCGCGKHHVHSKAEKELVEFLTEEILAERKAQKVKAIPTEIDGFKATLNGSEITLTKQADKETVKITFNVNHTVDTDGEPEVMPNMDKAEIGELKSKPSFKIDLIRGDVTVCLVCSFIGPNEQEEDDIFGIDEVSIYSGSWNEQVYAVSGEVIDSYLYDLLMNYLEEKGISNEFVEKLSDYSTAYEHSAYIGLLEGLSKFASAK
ncbi:complement component 1 Q subcomponent-binding protein, mitochondrial isoform X2 [Onthophagus taurus]|uniref:complement component 1 Q subcomponent-binding protein, mitochondrial isoform X2 n=1 Tax=Onthophagus taurus TaxID=166361 RepID=UPI000C2003CF|nr:complement component 1 Q subcomponent-binding protein, mitochondrial isoform X2 [Onthophagus taurus]